MTWRAWLNILPLVLAPIPAGASSADLPAGIDPALSVEELAIEVRPDHPREFIYTDKGAAHLSGEAVGADTRSYHGFYIAMHEFLDGWTLRLENGVEVGPATAAAARVYPDRLVRTHRLPSGEEITEIVTLLDRANGLRVLYESVPSGRFEIVPRVDMRFIWRVGKPAYAVQWSDGILCLARQDRLLTPEGEHPAWLALAVTGAREFIPDGRYLDVRYPKDAARRAMAQASPYVPGAIVGMIPPRIPAGTIELIVAAAEAADAAAGRARRLRAEAFDLATARRERFERLLVHSLVRTGVERDDRALAWARISLDNLIMEQRGVGIYAGFYWFTTYWGRDSFIVLPGACLVNGDFDTAETILRSFAGFQERDRASPREGRLPNFVTVDQVQFAGIDGTWWFVRALDELWRRSGRDGFVQEMAPVVIRAVEGALRHAVDEYGFLKHGDGETWMDAGGEANPYSPRGNRAVEVQALFHRGLLVAAHLAERFGSIEGAPGGLSGQKLVERYRSQAEKLAESFHALFWVDGRLADHLNADGPPDPQLRPNGLLAVLASPTLFSERERALVAREAAQNVVQPWGVQSLAASDMHFHPKHLDLDRYYYDEAYHNGDVWLWLSGPYISALTRPGSGGAFTQTQMLMDEILDEGAAGTLQEIRDGVQAASDDEFGGATSQAWSLSELLRTVVDDYLGLDVDLTAEPPLISFYPSPPLGWKSLTVRTRIGEYGCIVKYEYVSKPTQSESHWTIIFDDCVPENWMLSVGGETRPIPCRPDGNPEWPAGGTTFDIAPQR
jgi:glycogen debranching enzyme